MSRLSDLEIFASVVQAGSFTAAADLLDITKSYASRRVSALEERLGAQLLARTTRQLRLTETGTAFFAHVAPLLEQIDDAERLAEALHTNPVGTLRVTVPMAFEGTFLTTVVADFMRRWPELRVTLHFTDRLIDLVEEGFDLGIRTGPLVQTPLLASRLGTVPALVAASVSYLQQHGEPRHPRDLAEHECLVYFNCAPGSLWWFQGAEGEMTVEVRGRFEADNEQTLVAAAQAGLGIVYEPEFLLTPAITSGALRPILTEWATWGREIWVVMPERRHLATKVRLFVDFLHKWFQSPPWTAASQQNGHPRRQGRAGKQKRKDKG